MHSASPRTGLRLALITRDPALQRWVVSGAAAANAEVVELTPADWQVATTVNADVVLASVEANCARDLELIERLASCGVSPVALAAGGSINLAVDAMRRGAADFILQPSRAETLFERLADRITRKPAAHADTPAPEATAAGDTESAFIGEAPKMIALYRQIMRIAPSTAPAFITGESGTGKELCANAIHKQSGRRPDRFIAINCAAIPHDLMESELFGHVRGAFTGATDDRPGAMQLADGGTLFLDEICEMDLSLQAKLLRALQTGTVRRVGAGADESVNVRIICATNRDPEGEMSAGRFRSDLFYRLHVLPVHLPPLRERGSDVMKLANAFLKRFSDEENRQFTGFSAEAGRFLCSYDWPGNVRQLENLIRRIVVMHDGNTVSADMIPLALAHTGSETTRPLSAGVLQLVTQSSPDLQVSRAHANATTSIEPFWVQEKRIIESALDKYDGHVGKAAAALGISASTIYRKKLGWDDSPALTA
ncbi:MAG: sigma-54-dependent Fis family transcriptional regulator [Rhodobiaceae bacterium]|nr:sigma-54-dependent Fis family transcriptional regulator [Rhodobiaceae bacterium]MCC0013484.1 sigma-54-dependent Fis family transcriptional regulator [Rhodobiaceae bacterium]MCC0018097.1 sigma-54-dependent Fis family transcriptional regulator [Rhodobiaceae bacterium]MCC0050583.1 sigma-54-dependent Fis family transcriptional regulator [Rhodobiaceae bacterium]MCC0059786.1 sigma-54-dependent Fis family transcriptional regulator [Rhodobiaceae bacterium]